MSKVLKNESLKNVKQGDISLYINGEFVESASGKTFDNFNPYTNEKTNAVAEGDKADVKKAVAAASAAFDRG